MVLSSSTVLVKVTHTLDRLQQNQGGHNLPLALGSWELNLRVRRVDSLGTPEERFIENLRLCRDIVSSGAGSYGPTG